MPLGTGDGRSDKLDERAVCVLLASAGAVRSFGAGWQRAARRLVAMPMHCSPVRVQCGGVESFGGVERFRCTFRGLPAEGPAQDPLAGESNEAQPVVGQVRRALRMEVEIDCQLLDECRVARRAAGLLE